MGAGGLESHLKERRGLIERFFLLGPAHTNSKQDSVQCTRCVALWRFGAFVLRVPLGRLRYCPVSLGSSFMATGFTSSWLRSYRNTRTSSQVREGEEFASAATQSVWWWMLTVCLHGETLCVGGGLNTRGGPSRGGGSNLCPTSGSSCFTKIAERSWLKFHSNSKGKTK